MLVIGYGTTQKEADRNYDENLKRLLNRAREVNLKLNSKKMNLHQKEVKFMGRHQQRWSKSGPRQDHSH